MAVRVTRAAKIAAVSRYPHTQPIRAERRTVALTMVTRAMIVTAAAMGTIPAKRQQATNGGHLRLLLRQIASESRA